VQLQEINLRYGKVVNQKSPIIIEEDEKEETPNQFDNNDSYLFILLQSLTIRPNHG
jgi:hypothetical protein